MPRAAYTGSSPYAVFWGGDIGGTQEGPARVDHWRAASRDHGLPELGLGHLRLQPAADGAGSVRALACVQRVHAHHGSGTHAKRRLLEPAARRRATTTCSSPTGGCTRVCTIGWPATLSRSPSSPHALACPSSGRSFSPIQKRPEAWANWWTYLYGPDLVVSPVWEKGQRTQQVYLPAGSQWRDAWSPQGRVSRRPDGGGSGRAAPDPDLHPRRLLIGPGRLGRRVEGVAARGRATARSGGS